MTKHESTICDWAMPPGATVREIMKRENMTQELVACKLNLSFQEMQSLLSGDLRIDALIAQELAASIGGAARFWLQRDKDYLQAKQVSEALVPERWVAQFPLNEMASFGWVHKTENKVKATLDFFGVSSTREWQLRYGETQSVLFRKSQVTSTSGAVLAWLRKAKLEAASISCAPWSRDKFISGLSKIRKLTFERDPTIFCAELSRICAEAGVAVVFIRAPLGTGISGAACFLSNEKALIALSFRHLVDDQFWFSFFHEAGHLALHGGHINLDAECLQSPAAAEIEANAFAQDTLVPATYRNALISARKSKYEIVRLARKAGVAAGVLVGQLQRSGHLPYNRMNYLKRRYVWTSRETG